MLENELREKYLAQAEEHEWFESVLVGEETLESTLDDILERLVASEDKEQTVEILKEFKSHVALTYELHSEHFDQSYEHSKAAILANTDSLMKHSLKGMGWYLAGGLLMAVPILGGIGFVAMCLGGYKAFAGGAGTLVGAHWKEDTRRTFKEVYDAAITVDESIGRAFILDHFHTGRERFEQTYIALDEEEKDFVDKNLYEQLEFGAVDMAEHELIDYLTALKVGEPDA